MVWNSQASYLSLLNAEIIDLHDLNLHKLEKGGGGGDTERG